VEVVVAQPRYTRDGVLTRHAARRILRPYTKLLGITVFDAWQTWNQLGEAAPAIRLQMGRAARAMNVSDFINDEIRRRFAKVGGCAVTTEYGRHVLSFAGGDLKLRLGKVDLAAVAPPRNERQLRIWSQADATAVVLPGMPSGTWAKCGYLLDLTETCLAGLYVVCDMNGAHAWVLDLPMPLSRPTAASQTTPLQTSTVPPAKIASASPSTGARRRLTSSE
jgi:hypothetical protein